MITVHRIKPPVTGDDGFLLTVLQYEEAHPNTDIRLVLSRQKTLAAALAEHHSNGRAAS